MIKRLRHVEALISSNESPNPKGRKEQIRSAFYRSFLDVMAEFMVSVCQLILPSQYITISLQDRRLNSPDLVAFPRVSVIRQNF
jgi:hypothetical protein